MAPEPVIHAIGESKLGPSLQAQQTANRLAALKPLTAIDEVMETLARAEQLMAKKALERQETSNVVDQLRAQNRQRRFKGGN